MGAELGDYVQALVYTNVNDVILHLRVDAGQFRILHINPAFTRATGLSADQVVGKLVEEVIPEPSLSVVLSKYREAIAERRTVRWEEITEYPTGTKVGEVSVTPVFDGGQCVQLVCTVSDISELREQRRTLDLYGDIVRSFDIGLSVWNVPDPDDLESIYLAAWNPAAARLLSVHEAVAVGARMLALIPWMRGTEHPKQVAQVARSGIGMTVPVLRSQLEPGRVLSMKLFPLPGNRVCVATEDISIGHRATQLLAGERKALELLAAGAPLPDILTGIVRMIEELVPGVVASILLLDETGTRLRHGAAPGLPDAYNRALEGSPISAKAGSCGTAAFRGEPVYVADIAVDPLWEDYRELVELSGMRACWSTPILGDATRVLGTFAMYQATPGLPNQTMLELIGRATHIAAIVLERRMLEEQMRALTQHVEAIREDERTNIAREIHDELGQALTAFKLDLAWIGRRVAAGSEVANKLAEMATLSDEVIHSVRRISGELRPGILDDLGLAAALEWQAADFEARAGIPCEVRCELGQVQIERGLATAAFRIYQEALTNIMRHAGATRVDVVLGLDQGQLKLEVLDDGIGVPASGTRQGLGLLGMRERARRLGGDCIVTRREPRGTAVVLTVPIQQPA